METLNNQLETSSKAPINKATYFFLIFGLIGFLDATYLTIGHLRNIVPPCTIHGCEVVLTSGYSTIASIPVALFGALYYLTLLIGTLLYIDTRKIELLRHLARLTTLGLLASLTFIYLQAFVINAWCQYCLLSAAASTALFATGLSVLFWTKPSPPKL